MKLAKGAKPVLMVLVIIYAIVVIAFLVKVFTAKESPVKEDAVTGLVALSKELHDRDPKARELSEKEAAAVFDEAILERGDVIGFNYTIFMQVLNFSVLLAALYGLLWDPMIKFIDERRQAIRTDIQTAKEEREQAEMTLSDAEKELRKTREERRGIIDEAQREAESDREARLEAARKEAEAMIERAKREIEAHVAAGKAALRQEITKLSVELAEKIVEREIKEEDHAALVSQFIQEIENRAQEAGNDTQ